MEEDEDCRESYYRTDKCVHLSVVKLLTVSECGAASHLGRL